MPSIGETLREARMRRRLDIADVEDRTKIRAKYLRALENEDFGMLPGPTFVKTFLRTYAEVLGLDPHALVEQYRAGHEPRDELEQLQPIGPPSGARERRIHGRPGGGVLVALGVAAVLAVLLVLGLTGNEEDGGNGGEGAAQTETEPGRERERPRRRREPKAPPRAVALRIAPTVPTYVCMDTGAGTEVIFEGILDAPRTFRGRTLRVNLGKTSVEVRANGKRVPIVQGPEPTGFEFTPTGTRELPTGERPCA